MTGRDQIAPWEISDVWSRFESLEERHRRLQAAYDVARRALDSVTPRKAANLRLAWADFHAAVTQLGGTVDEISRLHAAALAASAESRSP